MNIGDVVYLKSGGPAMTVREMDVGDTKQVRTNWMSNGSIFQSDFPADALVTEDPSPAITVKRDSKTVELRAADPVLGAAAKDAT